MTPLEMLQLASVVLSPMFAAAGAYGAVRERLNALDRRCTENRQDINRAHTRIDELTACANR